MGTSGGVATPESQLLRTKIGFWLPELSEAGRRFVDHPGVRELYPEYLERMHWIVRASVPLMETARARALEIDDPVAAMVATYFEKHIDEEVGHDEWLLEDLEALGRDRAAVLVRPPSPPSPASSAPSITGSSTSTPSRCSATRCCSRDTRRPPRTSRT